MEKLTSLLSKGLDIEIFYAGMSTYYVYLSSSKYGKDFMYGYGKTLEEAVNMVFDDFESSQNPRLHHPY